MNPQTSSEIEDAYDEFHEALERLREQRREMFEKAAQDMRWLALEKIRKQIGLHG